MQPERGRDSGEHADPAHHRRADVGISVEGFTVILIESWPCGATGTGDPCSGSVAPPVEHPHCSERDPPAGGTNISFDVEVHTAGIDVIEEPATVRLLP